MKPFGVLGKVDKLRNRRFVALRRVFAAALRSRWVRVYHCPRLLEIYRCSEQVQKGQNPLT